MWMCLTSDWVSIWFRDTNPTVLSLLESSQPLFFYFHYYYFYLNHLWQIANFLWNTTGRSSSSNLSSSALIGLFPSVVLVSYLKLIYVQKGTLRGFLVKLAKTNSRDFTVPRLLTALKGLFFFVHHFLLLPVSVEFVQYLENMSRFLL